MHPSELRQAIGLQEQSSLYPHNDFVRVLGICSSSSWKTSCVSWLCFCKILVPKNTVEGRTQYQYLFIWITMATYSLTAFSMVGWFLVYVRKAGKQVRSELSSLITEKEGILHEMMSNLLSSMTSESYCYLPNLKYVVMATSFKSFGLYPKSCLLALTFDYTLETCDSHLLPLSACTCICTCVCPKHVHAHTCTSSLQP